MPTMREEMVISTSIVETKWETYNHKSKERQSNFSAPEALFLDTDMATLRIGRQLLRRRPGARYESLVNDVGSDKIFTYFEEHNSRGPYIVLATRQVEPSIESEQSIGELGKATVQDDEDCASDVGQDSDSEFVSQHAVSGIMAASRQSRDEVAARSKASSSASVKSSGSQISDETESSSSGSSDDTSNSDFARESCSEGSTEDCSEHDLAKAHSVGDSDANDLSLSDHSESYRDEVLLNYGQLLNDQDEAQIPIAFGSDTDSCHSGDGLRGHYYAQIQRSSRRSRRKPGSLYGVFSVYDTRSGSMVKKFHFEQDLPFRLYSSPPVIHPFESLAVWPLAAGKLLFANFHNNTYFIRSALPSTRNSKYAQLLDTCPFNNINQHDMFL